MSDQPPTPPPNSATPNESMDGDNSSPTHTPSSINTTNEASTNPGMFTVETVFA